MKKISHKTTTRTALSMCALGMLFYFYEYYLRVAPSVMNAELRAFFGLGEAQFGFLAACYYYAYTPMQIPVGMMMDRFGPRRILTFACFLCAVGTYLFAATPYLFLAQIGRFIVGFGSAFAYVGVLKIANVWLPKKYFALMAGICTTLGMFGAIIGEIAMNYGVEIFGWQSTLYYSALVGILLMIALWIVLREEQETATTPLSSHPSHIKFDGLKEMIVSPQLWITGVIGCLTFFPISGFSEIWAISFLQAAGMTKTEAALGSSMVFLGFATGGPLWGIVSDWIQSRRIPLIMGSFVSAALMALAVFIPTASLWWMYPLLFFSAFFASVEILIFAVSNDFSKPKVSATAIAFANTVVMIGGAFLPVLIGEVLDKTVQMVDNVPVSTVEDYSSALSVLPFSLVIAGILSVLLKESYHKHV